MAAPEISQTRLFKRFTDDEDSLQCAPGAALTALAR